MCLPFFIDTIPKHEELFGLWIFLRCLQKQESPDSAMILEINKLWKYLQYELIEFTLVWDLSFTSVF